MSPCISVHGGIWLMDPSEHVRNLGRLHRGGCGKMVALLTRMLRDESGGRGRWGEWSIVSGCSL